MRGLDSTLLRRTMRHCDWACYKYPQTTWLKQGVPNFGVIALTETQTSKSFPFK